MSFYFIPLLIAFIFYLLLPLSGAFAVRRGWRVFRGHIRDAGLIPNFHIRIRIDQKMDLQAVIALSEIFRLFRMKVQFGLIMVQFL